uniref:Serpentine Receptor, class H n=1 Tax=Caenorhabditis tropicalis TaxID=1561998 RepID=A0A1I7TXZ4_9PELO
MFESLPCLPRYLYEAPIFVLADDFTYHAIVGILTVLLLGLEALIYIVFLVVNAMQQVKSHAISRKTYEMQKKFFIALLIQLLVPFFFIFIPLSSAWIMVLKNYFNQAMVNFGIIMISMHGVLSSIVMISVHRPYREAVLGWFAKKKISVSVEVSEKPDRARSNTFVALIV